MLNVNNNLFILDALDLLHGYLIFDYCLFNAKKCIVFVFIWVKVIKRQTLLEQLVTFIQLLLLE